MILSSVFFCQPSKTKPLLIKDATLYLTLIDDSTLIIAMFFIMREIIIIIITTTLFPQVDTSLEAPITMVTTTNTANYSCLHINHSKRRKSNQISSYRVEMPYNYLAVTGHINAIAVLWRTVI